MIPSNALRFALSDHIGDVALSPSHVPLAMLGEFQRDVSEFLRGSGREVDPAHVIVSIEHGSFALHATGLEAAPNLWKDIHALQTGEALAVIDPRRAAVLERWQAQAKQRPQRQYHLLHGAGEADTATWVCRVDITTHFERDQDIWVHVEKYLHGKIVDWGGKTKPNVHLELENGKTLTVESSQYLIAQEQQNLVYRLALLHLTAEENLQTGDLRNLRLIAIQHHYPYFDAYELSALVNQGTAAWQPIADPTLWLEQWRGRA